MSSSDAKTKVDVTDSVVDVQGKINKADCVEGNPDNGVMAFLKYVIMVLKSDSGEKFVVERDEKWGGNMEFGSYQEVEKVFVKKELHPQDLKVAVAKEISKLLSGIDVKKLGKLGEKAYI
jgi:tyrosyl-tRNA synthetase